MCGSMADIQSATAEIRQGKKERKKKDRSRMWANSQRDGRPANIGGALCSTPTTRMLCSNTAKTRNPLKFAGVPQTGQPISAASRPKFTILWRHVEDILLLNMFFRLSICAFVAKI